MNRVGTGFPAFRRRLPIHMGQRQAIGIDDTIAARDRLKSPWSREAALRHRTSIRRVGAEGLSGDWPFRLALRAVRKAHWV